MRRSAVIIAAIIWSFYALAEQEIVLKDGSRIRGEVQSMQNGVYQVRTESMGTIQLGSGQIQSITAVGVPIPLSQSAVDSIKSSMASNPGVMSTIMELQNDPQMKAVLADPEIMQAVQNLDLQTLRDNPKIKALMNNSKIKNIHSTVN